MERVVNFNPPVVSRATDRFEDEYLRKENGDLIIDYLSALGVEYVFGVPGGGIEPLYNAIARNQANKLAPHPVIARHEAGAAFMADGYTRETGRLGVCCATTGPGTTNLITGVACAYADNIPMLVISAQTALPSFGKNPLQDSSCTGVNTVEMFRHCTRYSTLVSHRDQLEQKLLTAIGHAFSDTPGPVHLSIPRDVLVAPSVSGCSEQKLHAYLDGDILPSNELIKSLSKKIGDSSSGVFVLGKDCEPAIDEVLPYIKKLGWSIVTTPMGKGLIDPEEPSYCGVFGLGGHDSATEIIHDKDTDVVIAIGIALSETSSCAWDNDFLSPRLIHIDQNPERFHLSPMASLHVRGNIRLLFQELNERYDMKSKPLKLSSSEKQLVDEIDISSEVGSADQSSFYNDKHIDFLYDSNQERIKPQDLTERLSELCPTDTRFIADSGNSFLWGIHYWKGKRSPGIRKNLFRVGLGFASMGWGIGAAVGTALGCPDKSVVCMTGDGSLLMSGQEMTVALEEGLNLLFVILNDSAYGMVKHGQRMGGAEPIGFELPAVNFALMAASMGIKGYRIRCLEDLEKIDFHAQFAKNEPCVLDVLIDSEEVPPMGDRMKVLNSK